MRRKIIACTLFYQGGRILKVKPSQRLAGNAYTFRFVGQADIIQVLRQLGLRVGPFQYHVVTRWRFHNEFTEKQQRAKEVVAYIEKGRLVVSPRAMDLYLALLGHSDFILVRDVMGPLEQKFGIHRHGGYP